jgi:hypothetical protein
MVGYQPIFHAFFRSAVLARIPVVIPLSGIADLAAMAGVSPV